ncbi:MAG: energy transducer TonB [Deltaproteobacteria bacterium]|nr:energy transducer TonB [Deltaproteobacteria bacterium]
MERNPTNPSLRLPVAPQKGPPQPRMLRACVVQGGKVIEEQRLRRREPLSIGSGSRNTFVISDPTLPKTHQLFGVKGGQYELILTESMRGVVSAADKPVDFATLKAQGLLKKQGDYYVMPLNDQHRGKVLMGDVAVIFQFVIPPPMPAKPQLPMAARGSLLKSIDWPYAGALAAMFVLEAPLIGYVQVAPKPPEVSLENLDSRWAKLIVPERKEEPKKVDQTKGKTGADDGKKAAKSKAKAEEAGDEAGKAKAKAARTAKIRESIAGKGILGVLGTMGAGTSAGAVANVFGEGGIGGDLDGAFDGIAGVGLAAGSGDRSTRGGGTGEAATIGGLATAGGGKVGLGGKAEARVAGSVSTEAPEVDGALDSEAVAKVVRARQRMVQDCYERELKRDPTLQGKIEIEFTIGEDGRVVDAKVAANRMGSNAVGDCIISRLRSWRFPKPNGGSVTVNFPFIFTPSS